MVDAVYAGQIIGYFDTMTVRAAGMVAANNRDAQYRSVFCVGYCPNNALNHIKHWMVRRV